MKHERNILLIGVWAIVFTTICLIIYFYNKIAPLKLSTECANTTICEIKTEYNHANKEMIIIVTEPTNIMESWQQELSAKENNLTTQLFLPKSNFEELLVIDSYKHGIFSGQSLVVEFRISEILSDDYAKLKKHIKTNANSKSIKLVLPDMISPDKNVTAKLKNAYLKQKELERIAEEKRKAEEARIKEIQEYAEKMTYWRDSTGNAQPFKNTDFRKCLFKVKGTCYGQPFFVRGMSYMDCKAEKDKLGIKKCYASEDTWATTVKICGGVNNLPTAEDLRLLATDLYGKQIGNEEELNPQSLKSRLIVIDGTYQRDNSKSYLDYFRNTYWKTNTFNSGYDEALRQKFGFTIYSNKEVGAYDVTARIFNDKYTEYGITYRTDEENISICKAR